MAAGIPPPPLNSPSGSYYWLEWYTNLTNYLNGTNIPWANLNFTGSNLTDIQTRNHNDLQNIQGGATLPGTSGKAFHMKGLQYIGSVTSAGVITGPSGWTCSAVGGVYTITHSLGLATQYVVNVTQTSAGTLTGVATGTNTIIVTYAGATGFMFTLNQGS